MTKGMLLDMGTMNPGNGITLTRRVKVQSDRMEDILTYMREGRAYVNVMTSQSTYGAVRGQLVVPKCMDGELSGAQHHGFANIMISPDPADPSVAILVQVSCPPPRVVLSSCASGHRMCARACTEQMLASTLQFQNLGMNHGLRLSFLAPSSCARVLSPCCLSPRVSRSMCLFCECTRVV